MLESTFCHMPGIGPKTERRLWSAGILSWQVACERGAGVLSPVRADLVAHHSRESIERLAAEDARYFHDRLPSNEQWRVFPQFRHGVAYLDIETTGLGPPHDYITTVALYDGKSLRHYIHGENLEEFPADIGSYRLIVTYNGKCFDVPFIRSCLRLRMEQAHIDLRYVLRSLGYGGGLKGCERQLGLSRGDLEGIDGYFAVLLWQDYLNNGNRGALQTLLAYNVQDTINLETLMIHAYNMKVKEAGFAKSHSLPIPAQPQNPFEADLRTVQRIRRQYGWH